jgi:hypothetical protein
MSTCTVDVLVGIRAKKGASWSVPRLRCGDPPRVEPAPNATEHYSLGFVSLLVSAHLIWEHRHREERTVIEHTCWLKLFVLARFLQAINGINKRDFATMLRCQANRYHQAQLMRVSSVSRLEVRGRSASAMSQGQQ